MSETECHDIQIKLCYKESHTGEWNPEFVFIQGRITFQ